VGEGLTEYAVEDLAQCCSVPPYQFVFSLVDPDAPLRLGARDVPGTALFDFGDVELEKVVQPSDEFLSVHVVPSVYVRNVKPWLRTWAAA
jgi:hypothetical protein